MRIGRTMPVIAGDGDSVNIKSGVSTSPFQTVKQVDFVTPFTSIPRVTITQMYLISNPYITEVTTNYFKWNNGTYSGNVSINWIATTAGN